MRDIRISTAASGAATFVIPDLPFAATPLSYLSSFGPKVDLAHVVVGLMIMLALISWVARRVLQDLR